MNKIFTSSQVPGSHTLQIPKLYGLRSFARDDSIIWKVLKTIYLTFLHEISNNYVFVDTTWPNIDTLDSYFKKFNNASKTLLLYSGPDWENRKCRYDLWDYIEENKFKYELVGNFNSPYYFSFWLEFSRQFFRDVEIDTTTDISVPYMCLNRKPHKHRIELCSELYNKNLQADGYLSLGFLDLDYLDYKQLPVPITLPNDIINEEGDYSTGGDVGISNDITTFGNLKYWHNHFLNVVTETTIHTDVFISEKTIKPILGLRPFVVLGDDRLYDKLHEWGIDTFDDYFGNGYNCQYYDARIRWIVDCVNCVVREKDNLNQWYQSILPRLINNKKKLEEQILVNHSSITDIARKFSC